MEISSSPQSTGSTVEIDTKRKGWLTPSTISGRQIVLVALGSLLLYIILTALILWPLTAHLATSANNEGDDLQQMWSMGWVMHSLTHNPANLFNGNIFYPYPNTLAYSDSLIPQALLGLPIYLITSNLIISYNLVMFITFVLAAWGMFWLVRVLTSSNSAGLFAGVIFAFAPYKIAHLSQLNLLSLEWLPFVFLCLHNLLLNDIDFPVKKGSGKFFKRLNSNWGWAIGFGIFFVLQSLSSTYYFLFALPLYLVYFVGLYIAEKRWPHPSVLIKLAVVLVVAFLIMLPTLIPYLQVNQSQAAERTASEVNEFSANYRFYLGVPENNLLWGNLLAKFGGSGGERRLFPGALAYLFALLAIFGPLGLWLSRQRKKTEVSDDNSILLPRPRHEIYLYAIIGLFSVLMSFGLVLHVKGVDIPMPYQFFYNFIPGWKGLRAAVRYGGFVLFAVSVLAGIGLVFLQKWLGQIWATRNQSTTTRVWALPVLMVVLLLATFWEYRSDVTYTRPDILSQPPQVYNWLAQPQNAGPVLELPMAAGPDLPSIHDFYSTLNWQPLVNGESGYTPPVYGDLYAATQPDRLLSSQTLATLQGMGVRWLVFRLHDESMPLDPAQWQKLQPQLDSSKFLKLAYSDSDSRVYELTSDAWMNKISQLVPANSGLIVSDIRNEQPMLTELTETILQRDGHPLYGYDRAGYRFLNNPPTGLPITYGLFAADEDPSPYGFSPDEVIWSNQWLKLYHRKENLLASFDLQRDPNLARFHKIDGEELISTEIEGVRFNEILYLSNGQRLLNQAQGIFHFDTNAAQTISIVVSDSVKATPVQVNLAAGETTWRSGPVDNTTIFDIKVNGGNPVYLNHMDEVAWQPTNPPSQTVTNSQVAILQSSSKQQGQDFVSDFTVYAPNLSKSGTTHYNFTLDVYKRPWGTATSGHFGDWTVALTGQDKLQLVEFRFDPTSHKTEVMVNNQNADIGAQPIDTRDGPYTAYISLWQLGATNSDPAIQMGVARLYDFTLDSGKISEVNISGERQLVFLPPLPHATK